MSEERRRSNRLSARLTTKYKVCSTGKVLRALTRNISGIGVALVTDASLNVGTALELDIQLPDRSVPITCGGVVVWSRETGGPRKSYEDPVIELGVRFNNLSPKDQAAIRQYAAMNSLPPMGGSL